MRKKTFRVDIVKMAGGADIQCPRCKNLISPDDQSEEAYSIVDTILGEEDELIKVVIRCNRCDSIISLEGFEALSGNEETNIQISDAHVESEPSYRSHHIISREGKHIGQLSVEYAQKEDVKAFKRIRKLRAGEAFKATITMENVEGSEVETKDVQEMAKAVRRRFKGLRDRDIYVVEIKNGRKNFIGRASNL
jgi:phage FluMu protein Com